MLLDLLYPLTSICSLSRFGIRAPGNFTVEVIIIVCPSLVVVVVALVAGASVVVVVVVVVVVLAVGPLLVIRDIRPPLEVLEGVLPLQPPSTRATTAFKTSPKVSFGGPICSKRARTAASLAVTVPGLLSVVPLVVVGLLLSLRRLACIAGTAEASDVTRLKSELLGLSKPKIVLP